MIDRIIFRFVGLALLALVGVALYHAAATTHSWTQVANFIGREPGVVVVATVIATMLVNTLWYGRSPLGLSDGYEQG